MLSSSKWRSKEKILVGHNEGLNETYFGKSYGESV